jgi:phospholipase/carboxylesterase
VSTFINTAPGPHQGQPILTAGEPLTSAQAAMVLLHGRGATAANILELAAELAQPAFAYLAPQASENSWYPYPFLVPTSRNEPGLSSGLATISSALDTLAAAGFTAERTILLGFSQGACLMLEFVARHARRYGGVVGLSGGLIGPDDAPRTYPGSLQGTPAFLGCSDVDPHIPKGRVQLTTEVFRRLGGSVTERLYPAMGHTVNQDEIDFVRGMMNALVTSRL